MNIKKWCLGLLVMLACAGPALADGLSSTLNATTSIAAIAVVSGDGQAGEPYQGCVNLYGTFNSATVHWLVSTDDGVTKSPMRDLSGNAVTSTDADTFCFKWGWSPANLADQTIFYSSVSGALSAPSLTVDLFDNR